MFDMPPIDYPSVRVAEFYCSNRNTNQCGHVRIDIRSQSFDGPIAECVVTTSHPFPYFITSIFVPSGQMGWTDFDGYEYSCSGTYSGRAITYKINCFSGLDIVKASCECIC